MPSPILTKSIISTLEMNGFVIIFFDFSNPPPIIFLFLTFSIMKKIISLLLLGALFSSVFAMSREYADIPTRININNADYLASKKIIKYWENPDNYRFGDTIIRSEIMGMALAMAGITRNTTCR